MWGRLPTFFYSLTVASRRHERRAGTCCRRKSLTRLASISSSCGRAGRESRPVLEVRIDRRDGEKVTVDDCARASRALEARLDDGDAGRRTVRACRCRRRASVRCGRRPSGGGSSAVGERARARVRRAVRRRDRRAWTSEDGGAVVTLRAGAWRGEADPARRGQGGAAGVSLLISQVTGSPIERALFSEVLDGRFRRDVWPRFAS